MEWIKHLDQIRLLLSYELCRQVVDFERVRDLTIAIQNIQQEITLEFVELKKQLNKEA